MVSWSSKQILDPISSTAEIFGGDVMNWILQYHNNVDLAAGDPLGIAKIATETRFASKKFALYDVDNSNTVIFTTPNYAEDKEILLPSTLLVQDDLVMANAVQTITNKQINGAQNSITNIPDSAFAPITNKARLPSTIAYKDENNWLNDLMVLPHQSSKISIFNKLQLNNQIMYRDQSNDIGDNFLEFGDITSPGAPAAGKMRLFYNQSGSNVSAIKPGGQIVNLEEAVDINSIGFVPIIKGDVAQFTGDSINKIFIIPHGLSLPADLVTVKEASPDACGSFTVTKDATNIIVTYQIPPPSGAPNNVKLQWGATTSAHASSSFAAGGTAPFTGTGAQTVFNIPHGLTGTTPESYFAEPKNAATTNAPRYFVTADTTNVIITFVTAPTNGLALLFTWGAGFVNQAWEGEAIGAIAAGGPATKSGDGTNIFTIPHNLATAPDSYYVNAASVDARGSFIVTRDATNLIITYPEPPPLGSGNLSYVWGATYVGGYANDAFTPSTTDTFYNKTIGDFVQLSTYGGAAPTDPAAGRVRIYVKTIDADNDAVFAKIKVAGEMQEIQILP